MLSVRLRFKGCLQQAPALSFRNKFTVPKMPCLLQDGGGVGWGGLGWDGEGGFFPSLAPQPYRVKDLLESLRETKSFFYAGGRNGLGLGATGPAHRDPMWRNLRTGLSPAPLSDQAISCFAQTPILMRFKLIDLDSKNRGSGQGRKKLDSLLPEPFGGSLGLSTMQAWQMLPILQMAARIPKWSVLGRSRWELEHTEYPMSICGMSPIYPGKASKRGPVPGKSLLQPAGWRSAYRAHLCHPQIQGLSTGLCLVQQDLHRKLLET